MAVLDLVLNSWVGLVGSVVVISATTLMLLRPLLTVKMDPQEPPLLQPVIPFIGHILGMLIYHHRHFPRIYKKSKSPICTLPVLTGKMYVINSPELIQSTFRSRTLSFDPYLHVFIKRMVLLSDDTHSKFTNEEFFSQWLQIITSSLSGQHLYEINSSVLKDVAQILNEIPQDGLDHENFYLWTRELMTMATTSTLFGANNPWKQDPSLSDAYWAYEKDVHLIILNAAPWLTARKAHQGRAALIKAFQKYFSSEPTKDPELPAYCKGRFELMEKYSISLEGRARIETAAVHGALSNTIPTSFWTFVHIFHRPELVSRLQKEVQVMIEREEMIGNKRQITVNVAKLEDKCPLLMSTFREIQRIISDSVFNRKVLEDTWISDGEKSYLLKKGVDVQMSGSLIHKSDEHWGPSVFEFQADRFLKSQATDPAEYEQEKKKKRSFIPFGGGKHLCPGRNFATAEILGTVIALVLGFDLTGPEGKPLQIPAPIPPFLTAGLPKPVEDADLRVRITRKKGWENSVWKFVVED